MDIDLLSDILEENQFPLLPQLLPDLPRRLTPANPTVPSGGASPRTLPVGEESTPLDSIEIQKQSVITKIEAIFESIEDCILNGKKEMEIQLKSRSQKSNGLYSSPSNSQSKVNLRKIKFPSKCPRDTWRFVALCRILELSRDALISGVVTTKRDIYYREPELFIKQSVVDRYVDDIAYTLGINRDRLNIVAAAKGLMVGSLSVTKDDGHRVEYWAELDGMLIPKTDNIDDIYIGGTRWILVIEKEATFRTLAAYEYWRNSAAGSGIIITAKGYPDIQTRQFLHLLSTRFPRIPIYALVDFDPDGIAIMSTYKYGSKALAHETNIAVRSIRWIGVRSSDFTTDDDGRGLLTLSKRDRNIAKKMLAKQDTEIDGQEWRRELQMMLMLNIKAEIQIIGNEERLSRWLDGKLSGDLCDAEGDILMS